MLDNNSAIEALTKVLTENLKVQNRTRRWKALARLLSLSLFVFVFFVVTRGSFSNAELVKGDVTKPHTALIEVKGIIAEESFYGSAQNVIDSLQRAFKQDNVKGVILDLNSPGGSPVQSDLIYSEIKRLQAEDPKKRKVYSVVSDVCASGCYYLAAATEEIYANELSTVGSIGVLFSSFGAVDLMKKIGVDRRLQTAGKYKAFLDPFSAESEEGKQIIQEHLQIVHQIFIERVKAGRHGKLVVNNPDIFSGLFWTGTQAKELGLIDGFSSKSELAKNVIGAETMIDYTTNPTVADMLMGNVSRVSMSASSGNSDADISLFKKWLANFELASKYNFY